MKNLTSMQPALKIFLGLQLAILFYPWRASANDAVCSCPPMGWNSYNSFGSTVAEQEVRASADVMAKELKPYGWKYIVVDILWCDSSTNGSNGSMAMDNWGRFIPAVNRFPSSAQGQGFKPLADYVHSQGLQFGIHIMRGIPRQAIEKNSPILGTDHTARDIADTNSLCPWNKDMFGVDMNKPGAQEYYNSLFKLYASWGVDYVKIDDMENPDTKEYHAAEMEGYRKAMDICGRPMVCSISPRIDYESAHGHIEKFANLWRVSDDFWDTWPALMRQFEHLHKWEGSIAPGHFPDADMLIFGELNQRGPQEGPPRRSRFTDDERVTVMSLWSIARSPLMYGGDLTKLQPSELALLTNKEVLEVNQHSRNNRQLYRRGQQVAWVADAPDSPDVAYVGLFNLADEASEVSVTALELGRPGPMAVRDLWARQDLGTFPDAFARKLPPHGGALFRVTRSSPALANSQTYLAGLVTELGKDWPANHTVNIVCHGHSVPAGYFKTPEVRTFDAYPHLLHRGLAERFPHAVINVVVTAIGGENSEQGAARFQRDVLSLRPDVVTIDYALNDRGIGLARAEKAWRAMIEAALAANVKVILLTPTADTNAKLNDASDPLNQHAEQIRRLAAEYHVGLVDSLAQFKKYTAEGGKLADLMAQSNHPNRKGHELVAPRLLDWFPASVNQ